MPCFHVRALILVLLLGASASASAPDSLELATEEYLGDAGRRSLGTSAATAGGGAKGWLNIRLMAWYPALSGSGNDEGGGDYDVRDDLGLDENELAVVPQITVDFWIFGFRTDYFAVEFEGDGTTQRDFTFGGITFPAGQDVSSTVKITAYRSLGMISFLDTDTVRLAGIIGFNYYTYDATIRGATSGSASSSGSLPFPVVGALVQVRIWDILLEAEGSGFAINYGDVDATAIDVTVSAAWNFLTFGEVRVGYRFVSIDGTVDDTTMDIRIDGFFLAVGVTF